MFPLKTDRMRNLLFPFIAFVFVTVVHSSIQAQTIATAIEEYATSYSPERVYIHYDKSAYAAGETVWFKAYLMNEIMPADQSKTLYVDWIDDKGAILSHTVSPVVDAVTHGQFEIPEKYRGNLLYVKAYTKWMLNFDSSFIYHKALPIISPDLKSTLARNKPNYTINFFPEGGDLVAGVNSKVAFKANDQWGRPVKVKGQVIGNQGKVEARFEASHDGMGFFMLTPAVGIKYTVKWKDDRNVEHTSALPEVKADGATLQILMSGTNRIFSVNFNQAFARQSDTVHLVGTIYQHIAFQVSRATSTPVKGTIPTDQLPSGILTITLFDKNWNPLAERITFINNHEYRFEPGMEVQHWGLNKRARNELRIKVPDSLVANLSIAVTDAAIGSDSSNNIVSHLMLSSELKGEVYNPAQYFRPGNDSADQQLDLVMLTHGWRRFKWNDIVEGKIEKPRFARDTSYISLSGKVMGVLPGQLGRDASVILMVKQKDKDGQMIVAPIAPDGSFNDEATILFDTAQVYYSFQKAPKDAGIQFMTDRLPAQPVNPPGFFKPQGLYPDTTGMARQFDLADEANDIAAMSRVKTLENVVVTSRTKTPQQLMDEKYASGLFSGGDSYQFDLVNDPMAIGAMNIFNYLQGKVAGLMITTTGSTPTMQWRGGTPQLYLNETPVDASFVSSLSINDVAYIKVFRPPFMGGFNGSNGAIAIYTRRGDDVKQEPGKGLAHNKVFGYSAIKEFYSPNYASFSPKNEERDLRTTLYWNPAILTSPGASELIVTFYNNDVSEAFRVIIEGMTRDGKLARVEQIME